MTVIAIVQCGKQKAPKAAPACDLYTGPLFRALRGAAERMSDRWYIASAKHGLITPTRVIAPYDVTLVGMDEVWGGAIARAVQKAEPAGWDRIIALCSRRYLVHWAMVLGAETPLRYATGLGVMMQIAKGLGAR